MQYEFDQRAIFLTPIDIVSNIFFNTLLYLCMFKVKLSATQNHILLDTI